MYDWTPVFTNTAPFNFSTTNTAEMPFEFFRAVYQP